MNKESYESWYASKLSDMDIVTISVSDDWIVDYDKSRGMYRVSHFEDNHFVDEHWFDAYEDKEVDDRIEKIINKFEEIKTEIMRKPHCWGRSDIHYFCNEFVEWIKELKR